MSNRDKSLIKSTLVTTIMDQHPTISVVGAGVTADHILDALEQRGFEITRKARSVGNEDGGVSPAVHQAAMREHGGATIDPRTPMQRVAEQERNEDFFQVRTPIAPLETDRFGSDDEGKMFDKRGD